MVRKVKSFYADSQSVLTGLSYLARSVYRRAEMGFANRHRTPQLCLEMEFVE